MIKKSFFAVIAGLLSLFLLLTGCAEVTKALDEHFPEATEQEEAPSLDVELPDRVGRTYVILLTTQLKNADTLSSISLLTFRTADEAVHWLALPADLYIRASGNTLAGSYQSAYRGEMGKESGTTVSATAAGLNSLRSLLTVGFNIPIDYSINFDSEQFADFMKTIENVPITLSKELGGLEAGEHTLNFEKAVDFLTYDDYTDPTEGQFEARRSFAAALWQQAGKVITADQLSLYSMELRGQMTTDIPNTGGEDMFFLRRFLTAKGDKFHLTHISTQSVLANGARCRVLVKGNALRQLNEQLLIYQDELSAPQFDPSAVFVNPSDPVMQTIYTSSTVLPELYTMNRLLGLEPLEPDTEPAPDTEPTEGGEDNATE